MHCVCCLWESLERVWGVSVCVCVSVVCVGVCVCVCECCVCVGGCVCVCVLRVGQFGVGLGE